MDLRGIRALTFDVFGTLADWRSSITQEGRDLGARHGLDVDWEAFADAWRSGYGPAMRRIEAGESARQTVDALHRVILDDLLERYHVEGLSETTVEQFNLAWHRLGLWPDVRSGLLQLRGRYLLAPFSNGNVALLEDLSEHDGLEWDAVLSAETLGHFKPHPDAYRAAARQLGLEPGQVMMVAAHNRDLDGARAQGFRTAFVYRAAEYGPEQATDLEPGPGVDLAVRSLGDLAAALP